MAKNILIPYFSQSGNTKKLADMIQAATGGVLYDIGAKAAAPALDGVDLILVGTPNWSATLVPPVAEFLKGLDLAGKTVAVFCTHGMGGLQNVADDAAKLCTGATMLAPFAIKGVEVDAGGDQLAAWLGEIGAV